MADFDIKKRARGQHSSVTATPGARNVNHANANANANANSNTHTHEPTTEERFGYKSTTYDAGEKNQMLMGYDEVTRDAWQLLRPKDHIRYYVKSRDPSKPGDDGFRRGGFVHNVLMKGKPCIFVETGSKDSPGYAKWPVYFEDLQSVWRKRTIEDAKIATAATAMVAATAPRVADAEMRVEILEQRIDAMECEQKKILQAISRLTEKYIRMR